MSAGACPSLADLLLAAEQALPPVAQAQVSRHLQACVSCQSTLAASASLMDAVRLVMKRLSERETAEAAEARFQRFMEALHARKQQRIHRAASRTSVRRWIPLAATLVIAAIFLFESQRAVNAADELVKQAAIVEHRRPMGSMQRLRIALSRVGSPTITTEEELLDGILTKTTSLAPNPSTATLAQMLARHRFDWHQPLSVQHFDAWRRSLAHKQDVVVDLRQSPYIILRTTTDDDGELREVELKVERDSYRVVREVLKFEGGSLLDIDVRDQWIRQAVPMAEPRPSTPVSTKTGRPAPAPVAPIATLAQPDLGRWLAQRVGDLSTRQEFMPELRKQTSLVRQHLAALRDLSSRYPGADGAQASLAARSRLQRQVDLQYQTLRGDLAALDPRILILTSSMSMMQRASLDGARPDHAPADWEQRVTVAMSHAATLDRLAGDLRGYDDLPPAMQKRIVEAFGALWTAIYAPEQ